MISKMSNPTDGDHFDFSRGLKGRFQWVKRLIQSRTNPSSPINQRRFNASNKNQSKTNQNDTVHQKEENQTLPTPIVSYNDSNQSNGHRVPSREDVGSNSRPNGSQESPQSSNNHQQRSQQLVTRFDLTSEADNSFDIDQSMKTSSKTPSIAHESINTKPDNISTLPVISMSTVSVRSSTFSEHSEPSTSGTILSDHPTVYTNASTVGIPPASIMDRRERLHHPISLHNYNLANNNNSSHTVNTTTSPTSAIPNENSVDISSLRS